MVVEGTSVEMIDKTYGHLAADAEDYERGLLDAFDARQIEAYGQDWTPATSEHLVTRTLKRPSSRAF